MKKYESESEMKRQGILAACKYLYRKKMKKRKYTMKIIISTYFFISIAVIFLMIIK